MHLLDYIIDLENAFSNWLQIQLFPNNFLEIFPSVYDKFNFICVKNRLNCLV